MARPETGDILQLYISASERTIASALLVEKSKIQKPIYFVSHVLTPTEGRYPILEKLAYAVIITARRLRPYFDAHPIKVLTNQPLEKALGNMETSGCMLKWAVE